MLEEPRGRLWLAASIDPPPGRGVNFQITVQDAALLYAVALDMGAARILEMEDRSYRRATDEVRVRQFVVADPDGYLLRFSQVLAVMPPKPLPYPAHPPARP